MLRSQQTLFRAALPRLARCGAACLRSLSSSPTPRPHNPAELRASAHVDLIVAELAAELEPARDGGALRAVGFGDRGAGLCYRAPRGRAARLAPAQQAQHHMPPPSADAESGLWLLKVQAPLDTSSDGEGGIGRMVPDTLLLHDPSLSFSLFVAEGVTGHTSLLRAALKQRPSQVAYLWAEEPEGQRGVCRVYTELTPPQDEQRW